MALVDLDPDSWQGDYNSAERLHRHAFTIEFNLKTACTSGASLPKLVIGEGWQGLQ